MMRGGMIVAVWRGVFVVAIFRITLCRVVVMKMEEPLHQKHDQEPAQHPRRRPVQ